MPDSTDYTAAVLKEATRALTRAALHARRGNPADAILCIHRAWDLAAMLSPPLQPPPAEIPRDPGLLRQRALADLRDVFDCLDALATQQQVDVAHADWPGLAHSLASLAEVFQTPAPSPREP